MSNFSRLQLAAALLEYDNDPDNPDGPHLNAKESAIFAHLRRAPPPRAPQDDSDDDDDVPISQAQFRNRAAAQGTSGSRSRSVDARKSMAASVVDLGEDDPERAAEDEVLSAWGLDGLVDKDRTSRVLDPATDPSSRPRTTSEQLPNHIGPPSPLAGAVNTSPIRRFPAKRPLSMGDMDELVIGESPERSTNFSKQSDYRKSMNAALDFAVPTSGPAPEAETENPNTVNFPSTATPQRTPFLETPNPFEVALPNTDRLSKFDPKAQRRSSVASMGMMSQQPFEERQNRLSTASGQAPTDLLSSAPHQTRERVASMGTMGTQQMLDAENSPLPSPGEQEFKRLSRLDLLRPKVLVMPAPLQDQIPGPKKVSRDGFFQSGDGGIPLPPGSKTEARPGVRPISSMNPSHSINPRVSMSLSQLTFRQSLMVGGTRDPSYADIDKGLRMAANDGERIEQEWSEDEEPDKELRPAGKLYGKSLIDDLEARKATLKGKQRTFVGDDRPSMMQRNSAANRNTFIDPDSLNSRPSTQYLSPTQVQDELRRKRASGAPLVNLEPENTLTPPNRPGVTNTRSVFGVDKIWERELAKLKAAEEAERGEDAKLKALDARLDQKRKSTAEGLSPGLSLPQMASPLGSNSPDGSAAERPGMGSRRESAASLGARGWFNSPESEDEAEGSADRRASIASQLKTPNFPRKISAVSSLPQIPSGGLDSDEEDVPLAQQLAKRGPGGGQNSRPSAPPESDSDEDKPIAALKHKPAAAKSSSGFGLPSVNFDGRGSIGAELGSGTKRSNTNADDSSEDEVPLAVRHPFNRMSSMPAVPKGGDDSDEDDKPLGVKYSASAAGGPASQMQSYQQQLMMQQQMLQQQIMMQTQAQMHASMAFSGGMMNPAMMGGGFGVPFAPQAMSMQSLNINPLGGMQDMQTAQHSRVESWRRDVE